MEENMKAMLTSEGEQAMDERDGELISYDWNREDGRGEEAERLSPEELEDAWNAPAGNDDKPASVTDGESFRLKHLGREFDVTRDELITLAQKGADYDRIRTRADTLVETLRRRDAGEISAAAGAALAQSQRRDMESQEFIASYQGVRPEEIPQEVWREVAGGKSLLSAYQSYENRMLRSALEARRREAENKMKSTGSRPSLGTISQMGELEADWYRD